MKSTNKRRIFERSNLLLQFPKLVPLKSKWDEASLDFYFRAKKEKLQYNPDQPSSTSIWSAKQLQKLLLLEIRAGSICCQSARWSWSITYLKRSKITKNISSKVYAQTWNYSVNVKVTSYSVDKLLFVQNTIAYLQQAVKMFLYLAVLGLSTQKPRKPRKRYQQQQSVLLEPYP